MRIILAPITLVLFLLSTMTFAQNNSQSFGEYTIDYSLFPSTFLSADIAKNYGIKRSPYETLINIFVSKQGQSGGIPVKIRGYARNLLQQQQDLKFMKIKEEHTVYFIAPVRVTNEERLHFVIDCELPDGSKTLTLKFTKTLYKD